MIQKTLNAIGVTYSHRNDDILVPSRIEEERVKIQRVCEPNQGIDLIHLLTLNIEQTPGKDEARCLTATGQGISSTPVASGTKTSQTSS